MTRLARLAGGAKKGAALALAYFVADLLGATLAIHFLIDWTLAQLVLVLVAGTTTVLVGANADRAACDEIASRAPAVNLAGLTDLPTLAGVLAQGVAVLVFADLQYLGLRRSHPSIG